ncbi:MAG: zinc metallopeptidase [Treponema sp.]|jgi:Zn-dependent membrane protease YugP|nr:zinc metallopeptidase [Treponema sp.]
MYGYGFDIYYLVLVVPALLLSMWAQFRVKSTFAAYSRMPNARGLTGADAARILMEANNVSNVAIEGVAGSLTDHYDPRSRVLRLSRPVYAAASVAAVGVAAHETGHAIQHARGYGPLVLRSVLVPAANIGSTIGPWLAVAGIVMSFPLLLTAGIILFSGAVAFYLVTLPVEINASTRALAALRRANVLTDDELKGARKVLAAAALTYIASALMALMNLVRLVLLSRRRR